MNTEVAIISLIVFFSAVSILLGIINWIYLSSTSSKMSVLEEEIEKKAKEFDAIKKEKLQQTQSRGENIGPADNFDRSASSAGQENPSIEIVRNVRAEFRQPGPSADILDVVDDTSQISPQAGLKGNEIEITLYSKSKKDTDFAAAWQKLTQLLPVTSAAHVKINFINVMFLYEKELQYLEKILYVVSKEHGRATFINCHPELRPIISSRRSLARCLVD